MCSKEHLNFQDFDDGYNGSIHGFELIEDDIVMIDLTEQKICGIYKGSIDVDYHQYSVLVLQPVSTIPQMQISCFNRSYLNVSGDG